MKFSIVMILFVAFLSAAIGFVVHFDNIKAQERLNHIVSVVEADGVSIVWGSGEENCGAVKNGLGGCFNSGKPDTIYVSEHADPNLVAYLVAHEYSHAVLFREGADFQDECLTEEKAAKDFGVNVQYGVYHKMCS